MKTTQQLHFPNLEHQDMLLARNACYVSTYPGIGDFELPEDVLRHIVFGHGVHHEVLVPRRPLRRPVLMALFLGFSNKQHSQKVHLLSSQFLCYLI